ncbi:BRCT domain [Macleaya cordata]|uniref:protein-serine/threonine phosphatase n=1 Tax=Macleaya cordata TaxID=56857 RepID=A0A200R3U2_MACCD|nr:BRCT domain [Macleaya cordata]
MEDLYKYQNPISSGDYAYRLRKFAWAQAVQTKPPLNEFLMRSNVLVNSKEDDNNKNKSLSSSKDVVNNVVIDLCTEEIDSKMMDVSSEKEEGELEEGEIEFDAEMVEETEEKSPGDILALSDTEKIRNEKFQKQIDSIQQALDTITAKNAKNSFDGACSQLRTSLDSLQKIILENGISSVDALIQQSFAGLQAVNSVFCSMNPKLQEHNKDVFSRLERCLSDYGRLIWYHLSQVEGMVYSLDSLSVFSSVKIMDKRKEMEEKNGVNRNELGILGENPSHVLNSSKKFHLEPISVKYNDQSTAKVGSGILRSVPLTGCKGRGGFGPLLDLHRDHDMDSLPSPTRETPQPLPIQKPQVVVSGPVKSEFVNATTADRSGVHPYETDALKAVSTYQQKFGRTSFLLNTRLPSPTPSEESNDGDDDSKGEVSSSNVGNGGSVNPFIPLQTVSSFTSQKDGLSRQGILPARTVEQLDSGINPVLRPQPKSRDPRLRFLNSEVGSVDLNQRSPYVEYNAPKSETLGGIISSRKNKTDPESVLDGHTLKRQRNGLTSPTVSGGVQMSSGSGGWLEDISTVRPQPTPRIQLAESVGSDPRMIGNGEVLSGLRQDTSSSNINVRAGGNDQLPLTGIDTMGSLPSLLKDIAVNPTMLINLIREQQRLAAETQQKSSNPTQNKITGSSSNVLPRSVPLANVASSKSSEIEQKPAVKPQGPAETISTGEFGKIRMKPRDPRRILHNSTFQKNECLGLEQLKTIGASSSLIQASKDNLIVRQQGELAQTNSLPSHSAPAPDIAQQFTKELKNLADILSSSQATNIPSVVPQTVSSQTIPTKIDTTDMRTVVTVPKDQQSGTGTTPEEGTVLPSENKWEDVEHLFEGYDDQQRAAIHRERARRIEEQNKMFAARKLCLVLDLDHTLLNSAKFIEVDPVHDEILRKKEEQDREKPHRHLFRFPHMGMWTKLRPGVWNFLEKASKLYELHLYTMGNKLYATEMAKVLDPTGVLFAGRVISKGDEGDPFDGDERVPKSKDLEGVLGMESSVVIIDDSVRVWPHNKLNLIVVERYTYFPCSRRQFGLLGPSLLEIDHDERPEEGTLASSLAVIERIHQNFFSHMSLHDVDVRNILASEQRKILAGCRIVFSRVFPVGEANPHLHPLWQSAEQFGAVCTTQIDEQVTHVVANSLGTDKVNWALSTGRFVVHPSWVEASTLLYRRANEHDFAVKI